jgi:hypothetical protein
VAYVKAKAKKREKAERTGIDSLYEKAVEYCYRTGRFGKGGLREEFKIGDTRAKRLLQLMKLAKLIPPAGSRRPRMVVPKEARRRIPAVTPPKSVIVQTPVPAVDPEPSSSGASEPPAESYIRGRAAAKETLKWGGVVAVGEVPENIADFAELTIREVVERFGTDTRFADYLKSLKELEAITALRLKNARTEGALVSRELVKATVLEPVDAAHVQLLTDGARTIAVRASAMYGAGATVEELEDFISKRIGSFIKPVKARIRRALGQA